MEHGPNPNPCRELGREEKWISVKLVATKTRNRKLGGKTKGKLYFTVLSRGDRRGARDRQSKVVWFGS